MSDDLTLGDILSRVLVEGDPIARAVQQTERLQSRARYLCACHLSRDIASLLDVEEATAFDELTRVPDNMLALLQSPEGWQALAAWAAADLGLTLPTYQPTRH